MTLPNHYNLFVPAAKERSPLANLRCHIMLSFTTRERLRKLAFARNQSLSGVIEELVLDGLDRLGVVPDRDWLVVTSGTAGRPQNRVGHKGKGKT